MFVVSFVDFAPPARYDGIPYTFVDIRESADVSPLVWADIDTQSLAAMEGGIDADPSKPRSRNITTDNALIQTSGWYQLIWRDTAGNRTFANPIQAQHVPIYPAIPNAAGIRSRMPRIEWAEMGFPAPAAGQPDLLEPVIADTVHEFRVITGQDPLVLVAGKPTTTLAAKAIRLMVAFNANRESQELLETATDFDLLGSLSQGPASESRRSMGAGRSMLHPSPVIDRILRDFKSAVSQDTASLDRVPGVNKGLGFKPRPGQFVMEDPKRREHSLTASVYGALPTLGVALYVESG